MISFFRAEAERRQIETALPSVVYAIEEPETSQHPEHQRALIDALIALAGTAGTQIILSTLILVLDPTTFSTLRRRRNSEAKSGV